MAKKDNGNANAGDDVLSKAAVELGVELGVIDLPPAVAEYAPPDDPGRMSRTAELSGAAIRAACDSTAQSVLDLAADAENVAKHIREEAEHFAKSVREIGGAHATRIEQALLGMKSTLAIIAAEKLKIAEAEANVS